MFPLLHFFVKFSHRVSIIETIIHLYMLWIQQEYGMFGKIWKYENLKNYYEIP